MTPTRSTASGCSVSGTGLPGIGMAICAAIAISALPPMTSNILTAARPRTRRSSTAAGMVISGLCIQFPSHENRGQQRDRSESAQADAEGRSISDRSQTGVVRQRERTVPDDRGERGHDDRFSGLVRGMREMLRILFVAL